MKGKKEWGSNNSSGVGTREREGEKERRRVTTQLWRLSAGAPKYYMLIAINKYQCRHDMRM